MCANVRDHYVASVEVAVCEDDGYIVRYVQTVRFECRVSWLPGSHAGEPVVDGFDVGEGAAGG